MRKLSPHLLKTRSSSYGGVEAVGWSRGGGGEGTEGMEGQRRDMRGVRREGGGEGEGT